MAYGLHGRWSVAPVARRFQQARATVPWVGVADLGTCAARAARARLWRRASTTWDDPLRQPHTAPPRPTDASRSPPIAGGEIELGTAPCGEGRVRYRLRARAHRAPCARRDCPGASRGPSHTPALALAAASRTCTSMCAPHPTATLTRTVAQVLRTSLGLAAAFTAASAARKRHVFGAAGAFIWG